MLSLPLARSHTHTQHIYTRRRHAPDSRSSSSRGQEGWREVVAFSDAFFRTEPYHAYAHDPGCYTCAVAVVLRCDTRVLCKYTAAAIYDTSSVPGVPPLGVLCCAAAPALSPGEFRTGLTVTPARTVPGHRSTYMDSPCLRARDVSLPLNTLSELGFCVGSPAPRAPACSL